MNTRVVLQRTVLCLCLVGFTATLAESQVEYEDFGQIQVMVQQKGVPQAIPINYVGMLGKDDKMLVKVNEKYTDTTGIEIPFTTLLYKKIAVLFVPAKKEQLPFMQLNKSVTYQERNLCTNDWQPCEAPFEFTAPYPSFPILFLVSKGGYKDQLVKMVTPQNFQAIGKSSRVPFEMHIAAQKLNFLSDLTDTLTVKKIESRKILQALFESASSKYKLFEKTGCAGADGEGMKKAKAMAEKRKAGAEPTQSEIYKGQLLCLVESSDAAVQAFNNLRQSGAFDVKSVVYLLANTALNVFIDKFPSMGIYFTVAKLALVILQEIFQKAPLEVTSAFAKPATQFGTFLLLSAPTDVRITPDTMAAAEVTDPKEKEKLTDGAAPAPGAPAKTERARFFLPMELRGGMKFSPDALAKMKPEPKIPCLTKGDNAWGLDDKLLNDPLLRDLSVTLYDADNAGVTDANASKKIVFSDEKAKKTAGFIGITIKDDQWDQISTWKNPRGTIRFSYGNAPATLPFESPVAKNIDTVTFTTDSAFKLRRGQPAQLVFTSKDKIPSCVDKVVYNFGGTPFVQDVDSLDKLTLSASETEAMTAGTGKIEFQQYGLETPSSAPKITLLDHVPTIASIKAAEGDDFGILEGTQLMEFKTAPAKQHTLVFVDEGDNEIGNALTFTFKPTSNTRGTIRLDNGAFPQEKSRFKVKMKVPGGEAVDSGTAVVAAARPAFITSEECVIGEDKSHTLAITRTVDETSPFDLGACISPITTATVEIVMRRPNASPYRFGNGQKYKVLVTAVSKGGDEDPAKAKVYETDTTADTRSATLKLPISTGQFEPVRDITDEGTVIRLKLSDPVRGDSDWYTLGQEFVNLPKNLLLDCTIANKCRLSGDLAVLDQVAVSENSHGEPQWTDVGNVAAGGYLSLPLISIPAQPAGVPYYFYIKTRGSSRGIKVRFLPGNTSFAYKAIDPKVPMSPQ